MYVPDNWVVIFLNGDEPHYRLLVGWSGGYLNGDSWKISSGITRVEETDSAFLFYAASGSCYACGKQSYCLRMNNAHIWEKIEKLQGDKTEMLPEKTDWLNMDWIIK